MKKVNFITTLSPEKQHAIKRWFLVTFFLSVCSLGMSVYFIVPQLLMYIALHKKVKTLRIATQEHGVQSTKKDALKTEHDQMRICTKKIEDYNSMPKNPHAHITAVVQACGDGVTLEAIKLYKKDCDITLLCPTSEHAMVFIKRLSVSDLFMNVKLVSLQQDTQTKQLRCVVKGKVR